jgi:uncharacterized protein (TIGR02453 family)
MPFTQKTIDFLFENRLHDSREWFNAHKDEYKALVIEPMTELVNEIAPTMAKIDKLIVCDPKKISRIYRDARYARDSVFRDEVWYTFARPRENAYVGHPGFYFAIGVSGISYGCGYYCADSAVKDAVRKMILSDDEAFTAAFDAYNSQKTFAQYGELYKKNRYPDQPPEKCDWLNRKEYGVSFGTNDPKVMFSEKLFAKVARDFVKIAPLYDFYMKAQLLSTIEE